MADKDTVLAYDSLAEKYELLESSPAFKQLRVASLANLISTFRQGKVVLDIGCSQGTEAISLARHGITVVGIDPSKEMVEIARKRAKAAKLSNVHFYLLSASELRKLPGLCGIHRFDGAYSSLGALNFEPVLEPVRDVLLDMLNPGSPVIFSLRNKTCAVEMLANLFSHPSKTFQRRSPFMKVPIAGTDVMLRMYSVREIIRSMKPMKKISVRAISFLVPPAHLSSKMQEDILEFLSRLEEPFAGLWPINRLGDYVSVTFVRR